MRIQQSPAYFLPTAMQYLMRLGLIVSCLWLGACQTNYYTHLIKGQSKILGDRQSIASLIDEPKTQALLKDRLILTQEIIKFAQSELQITTDNKYTSYVNLQRPYVIMSLMATPEFSLTPYTWCYPLIGCASYRGYFSRKMAHTQQQALQDQGYITALRGVSAYSTLGWFADPLLSSFIFYDKNQYVELLFHELAHSQIYIGNDTAFNESFATFVGLVGLKQWQLAHGEVYNAKDDTWFKLVNFLQPYRLKLEALYASHPMTGSVELKNNEAIEQMRQAKHALYAEIKAAYAQEKLSWSKPRLYDQWMASINNPKMASLADYTQWVLAFEQLYVLNHANISDFYKSVEKLGNLPYDQRHVILSQLGQSCWSHKARSLSRFAQIFN